MCFDIFNLVLLRNRAGRRKKEKERGEDGKAEEKSQDANLCMNASNQLILKASSYKAQAQILILYRGF